MSQGTPPPPMTPPYQGTPPRPPYQGTPPPYQGTPPPYQGTPPAAPAGRPWRDRVPELVASIGLTLVVLAIVGFVTSTWEDLNDLSKAIVVGAVAVGMTIGGHYVETKAHDALRRIVALVYAAASVAVAGAVTLAGLHIVPGYARFAIALAGLAAAGHAWWIRSGDVASPVRTLTFSAALLYASGPVGSNAADRYSTSRLTDWFDPLGGLLDPGFTSEGFVYVGIGWLIAGAVTLLLSGQHVGRAQHLVRVSATVMLILAAASLNLWPDAVGALLALLVAIGYLIYGLVAARTGVVIFGSVFILTVGLRVLAGLFSGGIAITIATLVAGVGMLAWAVRAAKMRDSAPSESVSAGHKGD
jgi:hypothetical protein